MIEMSLTNYRPMKGSERRTTRSMDREAGHLISTVSDDDTSFEVIPFIIYVMT